MFFLFFGVMAVLWCAISNRYETGLKLVLQIGWIVAWVIFLVRYYT